MEFLRPIQEDNLLQHLSDKIHILDKLYHELFGIYAEQDEGFKLLQKQHEDMQNLQKRHLGNFEETYRRLRMLDLAVKKLEPEEEKYKKGWDDPRKSPRFAHEHSLSHRGTPLDGCDAGANYNSIDAPGRTTLHGFHRGMPQAEVVTEPTTDRTGPHFNGLCNEFEEELPDKKGTGMQEEMLENIENLYEQKKEELYQFREGTAEPLKPVPNVYINDATHGQHPRKVVVYLE